MHAHVVPKVGAPASVRSVGFFFGSIMLYALREVCVCGLAVL